MDLLFDSLACGVLLLIAAEDLRRFRIRNSLVLGLAALFAISCWASGSGQVFLWHGAFATLVLVLMFGAFSLGVVGAGDAKLMTAACLWVGPESAVLFAMALLALTLLYCIGAKLSILPVRISGIRTKIPFGPCITGAWISTIAFGFL